MDKKTRKAQMSIEYIGGFMIFIIVLMYVFFFVLGVVPQHALASHENTLETSSWRAMQNLMDFITDDYFESTANLSAIRVLSDCGVFSWHPDRENSRTNYTRIHDSILGLSNMTSFHIEINQYVVALTPSRNSLNFTGASIVGGKTVFFETINTSAYYDRVLIDNGTKYVAKESPAEFYLLGGSLYSVEKIDPAGQFVIMKSNMVDCGKQPSSDKYITRQTRFTREGSLVIGAEMVLW